MGDPEGYRFNAILTTASQAESHLVPLDFELTLNVLERGEGILPAKARCVMLGQSLFPQLKEAFVGLNHFVTSQLHGHGVVTFCPRQLFEDEVQILPSDGRLPSLFVLFAKMPEKSIIDLGCT
jgi:hypothetical protein